MVYLTVIKTEAACFCKKGWALRLYGSTEFCFNYKYYKVLLRNGKDRCHGTHLCGFRACPWFTNFYPVLLVYKVIEADFHFLL